MFEVNLERWASGPSSKVLVVERLKPSVCSLSQLKMTQLSFQVLQPSIINEKA
jgi:hypothetical protein